MPCSMRRSHRGSSRCPPGSRSSGSPPSERSASPSARAVPPPRSRCRLRAPSRVRSNGLRRPRGHSVLAAVPQFNDLHALSNGLHVFAGVFSAASAVLRAGRRLGSFSALLALLRGHLRVSRRLSPGSFRNADMSRRRRDAGRDCPSRSRRRGAVPVLYVHVPGSCGCLQLLESSCADVLRRVLVALVVRCAACAGPVALGERERVVDRSARVALLRRRREALDGDELACVPRGLVGEARRRARLRATDGRRRPSTG